MPAKKTMGKGLGRGLGRGLDSLIPPASGKDSVNKKKEEESENNSAQEGNKKVKETVKAEKTEKTETAEKTEQVIHKEENENLENKTEDNNANIKNITKENEEVQKPDFYLKISDIEPNRSQPRKNFDEDALLELADSIRQYGVLSPILVKKNGDYYEIVAGERRWRAAKLAGLKEVPVLVRSFTDQELVEVSLIENIQRENLNPIEEAQAFQRLMTEFGLTQEELGERVSKSRTAVTNTMRLLKLDERVQQMLVNNQISAGHARAILTIEDGEKQYLLTLKVIEGHLSVRETEKLVKQTVENKTNVRRANTKPVYDYIYRDLEERMAEAMGTKVNIAHKKDNKGKIEISYHSEEELERITALLLSLKLQ